jgi:hypothetical protein
MRKSKFTPHQIAKILKELRKRRSKTRRSETEEGLSAAPQIQKAITKVVAFLCL